jgi:hypothetical protein
MLKTDRVPFVSYVPVVPFDIRMFFERLERFELAIF